MTYILGRDIEQTVVLYVTYSLSRDITQAVVSTYSVQRDIEQRVVAPIASQDAIQWEAIVDIDGTKQTQLTGSIEVSGGENEQGLAIFQIKPLSGAVTVADYVAKPVKINYADQTNYRRLFTGIIDEVEYDATDSILTFTCITNRKERINSFSKNTLKQAIGGYWSEYVFDKNATSYEYARDLLSTVPKALENTPYGQYSVVNYLGKSTPDITYTEADILDDSITPEFVSRDQLINSHELNFDYRFYRLRQRERDYQWNLLTKNTLSGGAQDGFNNWGEFMRNPVTLMPVAAVEAAIEANQWILKDNVEYVNLPDAGFYGGWGWTPKQSTVTLDDQGNVIGRSIKNIQNVYCTKANFTLAIRFAQIMTEGYKVTIKAPQSINQYGEIKAETSRGMTAEYDTSAWEDYTAYTQSDGYISDNGDWVTDKVGSEIKGGRNDFDAAILTAQGIVRTEILDSHRQNYVEFETLLDPNIDLTKTVYVDTDRVEAKGKVYEFAHTMVIDGGEPEATTVVKLAISKATGSQSDTPNQVPNAPTITDGYADTRLKYLQNHFGNHYRSKPYDPSWSGYIGNYKYQDYISANIHVYPTKFTIDSEKIGDQDRKERKVPANSTVNIEIPDELLTITAP